jgi:hypothetical protein
MFKRGDLVRSKDQNFLPWTGIVLQCQNDEGGTPHVQVRRTEPTTLGAWVVWELEKDVCKAGQ